MKQKRNWKKPASFIAFVGPAFLAFVAIVLIPFFNGIYYSFTDWNGVTGQLNMVGLDNYHRILFEDEQFRASFWITTKYTLVAVVLTNIVGFLLALLLTMNIKTRNLLRTIFFMPNLIGGLILGFIWQFIYVKGFESIGALTGWSLFELPWLGDAQTAFWGIVIVAIWQGGGYVMVIYIAALQNVPTDLLEAAKIDGANKLKMLRHITLPMIMPSITICLFLTISWSFKVFDTNLSLTNGGPFKSTEMLALNIYTESFVNNNYGLGSAKAVIFFLVVAAITVTQVYLTKKREVEA
ncbi:sugar ABC transporter permease [Exiguobacterium sp. SL-10]|nr:sugar ABC transporter permease [Exiguobacterium sp. SL-10]